MTAGEPHWWIGVGRLLPQYRARKNAMEPTVRAQIDLDGQLVFRVVPHAGNLALLHNLWRNFDMLFSPSSVCAVHAHDMNSSLIPALY